MNSTQIQRFLRGHSTTSRYFLGVFPSDQLPPNGIPKLPCCMVCNTDPADQPGQHWVALYFGSDGVGEYFDSYGQRPTVPSIQTFLEGNSGVQRYNNVTVQGHLSSACGHYCAYYLLLRCGGLSMTRIVCGLLRGSTFVNDCYVTAFVNKHARLSTEAFEDDIVVQQLCTAFGV
jgi:hypothetical protein